MRQIDIEIKHEVSEHIEAYRLYYANFSKFVKIDRIVGAIPVLISLLYFFYFKMPWFGFFFALVGLVELFNIFSFREILTKYQFKKIEKFKEINKLVFSEQRIDYTISSAQSKLEWSFYNNYIENEKLILLIYDKWMYSVIPKRCFKSKEDLSEFKKLIDIKLEKQK